MNNDNVSKYDKSKHVDNLVAKLSEKLGTNEGSRPFLCKAAYRLTEAKLWDNCEQALKGRNAAGLFIFLCKRDGV